MTALASRRAALLAPLGIAVAGGAGFLALLGRMRAGTYDPHAIPSPLIGKRIPAFALPGQTADGQSASGFSDADLRAYAARTNTPVLLNFFASWCVPCVVEAPVLAKLGADRALALWGVAYKDKPDATATFLRRNGDPYARLARDEPGQTAIDFGLYGVPESFLIDSGGIIRWKYAGPLTEDVVAADLMPMLRAA